jgi:CheY-like chemotaxis protein|tara:strand:+ start:662 stop:1036 length:375 start_codon:yes stop_codon:yes gene_type:complete
MLKSVLVIDDDKICNFLTVNALKKTGINGQIEVVINGLEAINLLKEVEIFPDLILLDINMPIMGGLEFLNNYKTLGFLGKTKIAIYTSSIRETDKKIAFKFPDVVKFINKPLTQEKLIDLLNKV